MFQTLIFVLLNIEKMIAYFNETPIYYSVKGKGSVLVLLHGFLLSTTYWNDFLPMLLKKHQVITIDLPGHGKSGCISETHSMELMADVVHFIIEELNIEKINIIGHSMGGYIALAFTEKYELKVGVLVLLNSTPFPDSSERKKKRDRAVKVVENNPELFIKMAIRALFPVNNQMKYFSEIETLTREACQFPIDGITAAIKGMKNRKDRTIVLKNFSGKKYLICGEIDPIISYKEVKKAALQSNSTLLNVKSGHMSLIENIDEIIKIMQFIDYN